MKKIVLGVSLALTAGSALAGDDYFDDRWYVTPNASFVKPDTDKNANSGVALGIAIGKFITEKVSLDFEVDRVVHDLKNGGELTQQGYNLIGRYYFGETQGLNPYLGLGIGAVKHKGLASNQAIHNGLKATSTDALGSFIGGISKSISENIKLRAELRYQLENSDDVSPINDTFTNFLFNAGVSFAFGAAKTEPTKTTIVEKAPQMDSDNDGVIDSRDRCPNTPAGTKVDSSGCAIVVDGDDDRDGVPNSRDVCPSSKPGAVVGADGCEVKVVIELQGVHFDTDKSTLKPVSISILDAAVRTLGEHGTIMVEVAGHTDSRASDAYNQALSQRRAKVVFDYLVSHGISADRMTWRGYGENSPIATNDTAEGRARNRRTELIVK